MGNDKIRMAEAAGFLIRRQGVLCRNARKIDGRCCGYASIKDSNKRISWCRFCPEHGDEGKKIDDIYIYAFSSVLDLKDLPTYEQISHYKALMKSVCYELIYKSHDYPVHGRRDDYYFVSEMLADWKPYRKNTLDEVEPLYKGNLCLTCRHEDPDEGCPDCTMGCLYEAGIPYSYMRDGAPFGGDF